MECYLAIERNEIMPFAATWMDLKISILRRLKRKTNIIWYHSYVESSKKLYSGTCLQNR